jgi:dTDP-4-amino-4,6-dideoxygalactose transaminase
MVVSDDADVLSRVNSMRSSRIGGKRTAYSYTMSDLQAALGRSQLARLGSFLEKRKQLVDLYRGELAGEMESSGIECRRPFEEPVFKLMGDDSLPGCRRAYEKLLSLPIYPSLEEKELLRTTRALKELIPRRDS